MADVGSGEVVEIESGGGVEVVEVGKMLEAVGVILEGSRSTQSTNFSAKLT